ncbi:MAG TPA: hypothetical protein VE861_12745, partial [Gemmatimonadaceae bacterium]|nr:hypothetical protein [Gemmatimonadaceae bacterium]
NGGQGDALAERTRRYYSSMLPTRHAARRLRAGSLAAAASVLLLAGCASDDFDKSQVPKITVTPVVAIPLVVISWEPAGAQEVRVYKGVVADGNTDNLVWAVSATGINTLVSGIEYGTDPPRGGTTALFAKALTPGLPYTVQVSRRDPKASGNGPTSTRNRYSNVQTFTIGAVVTPP